MLNKLQIAGILAAAAAVLLVPHYAAAIQGCTLKNPDRDVRKLFPLATDYRSHFVSLKDRGGEKKLSWLAERLGDKLDPVYEAADLPYAYYEVLNGEKVIGFVFGVNQKGRYGGMQLILATDTKGAILDFYYQKLSAPDRKAFTNASFTDRFKGLALADFYYYAGYRKLGEKRAEDKVGAIKAPGKSEATADDFKATIRGLTKALILFDHLWLKDRNEPVFLKVKAVVEEGK